MSMNHTVKAINGTPEWTRTTDPYHVKTLFEHVNISLYPLIML